MNKIFSPFLAVKQSARMVFAIALVITLPITVFLISSQQDTRQFASTNSTTTAGVANTIETITDRTDYAFTIPNQTDFITFLTNAGIYGTKIISLKGSSNSPLSDIVIHLANTVQPDVLFPNPQTHLPVVTGNIRITEGKAEVIIAYADSELTSTNLTAAAKKAEYATIIQLYNLTHPVKSATEAQNRLQILGILLSSIPSTGYIKLMPLTQ